MIYLLNTIKFTHYKTYKNIMILQTFETNGIMIINKTKITTVFLLMKKES